MKKINKIFWFSALLLGILILFNFNIQEAKAAVQEYKKGNISLTWNLPQKDAYYTPGDYIVFLGTVNVSSCFNTIDEEGKIRFYLGTKQYPNNSAVLNDLGTKIGEKTLRKGGSYYVNALKIPTNFVGTPEGYAYARIYFTGRYWHKDYAIVASERILIIDPKNMIVINRPPKANAGPDKTVLEGQSVVLEGSGFDLDNDPITFSWSCTGGTLSNPNIAQPTYTAPLVTQDTTYTCTLTVSDDKGGSSSDSMNVLVKDNRLPDKPEIRESWNHCGIQGLSIPIFHWTYSDPDNNPQAAYQIKIYGETTLDETITCYSSPCLSYTPTPEWVRNNLNWGKTYSWQVRVKDNQENWSEWSDPNSFTMPRHAYPWPDFSHSPEKPSVGEIVNFTDLSKCYSSPGNTEYNCKDGGASIKYAWDFDYIAPDFTVDSTQKGDTTTTYSQVKNYQVRLRITDYTLSPPGICTGSGDSPVGLTLPLPEWKEIPSF